MDLNIYNLGFRKCFLSLNFKLTGALKSEESFQIGSKTMLFRPCFDATVRETHNKTKWDSQWNLLNGLITACQTTFAFETLQTDPKIKL